MRAKELKRQARHARADVDAVADELAGDVVAVCGSGDGAGIAVMQAGHRVKEMRHMACASRKGGACLLVAAAGVGNGYAQLI